MPTALSPWRIISRLATVAPHDTPALWTDGTKTLMAWPGEPSSPSIRLVDSRVADQVKVLQLGRIPRSVSLFSAGNNTFHLVWLDQTLPGQSELVGAMIDSQGTVTRPPGQISKHRVSQYRATVSREGNLIALWVEDRDPSAVYLQLVDSQGRPKEPIRLAQSGTRPALSFDMNGDLHVAWLESTSPSLWTIRYLFLPRGEMPVGTSFPAIPVGVIRLDVAQLLDSFTLGADASYVYCLWGTLAVGQDQAQQAAPGKLGGLSFPITDSTAVHSLPIQTPDNISLTIPTVPSQPLPSLTIGVLAGTRHDDQWQTVPAAVVIRPNGSGDLHAVYDAAPVSGMITGLAAAATPDGGLVLGWSSIDNRGIAQIFYASTQ